MTQDNTTIEKNRTEDVDGYSLLGIRSQPYGPSYEIKIKDAPDADVQVDCADVIRIAGVHVGVSDEAEIECKEWRIVGRDNSSRQTLVIDPIEEES